MATTMAAPTPTGPSLSTLLTGATFYHEGTALATDRYVYRNMKVSYNEPDNVTCAGCGWHVGNGAWEYLWQRNDSHSTGRVLVANVLVWRSKIHI